MDKAAAVLGMPLEQALRLMGEEAASIRIVKSEAPRTQRHEGTLRVIRVREGEWTVSAFLDGMPGMPQA